MMARTAIKVEVKSLEDMDRALAEIGRVDLEMQQIELEERSAISLAEQRIKTALSPLAEKRKRIEAEIYAYASANPEIFGKKRSVQLAFGKVDIRNTPAKIEQLSGVSVEESARRIQVHMPDKYDEFVVEKPSLIKTKLRELGNDVLARLGLRKTRVKDQYGVKIRYDKVKEALGLD